MSEHLSHEARRIIELGRGEHDPTAAQRERVRAGLAAGVAAIGVTTAGAGAATAATVSSTAGTGSLLGIKLAIVTVVAVGAGVGGTVVAVRSSRGASPAPVTELAPVASPRVRSAGVAVPALERLARPAASPPPQKNNHRTRGTGDGVQGTGKRRSGSPPLARTP